MNEVECVRCEWSGDWEDVVKIDGQAICPVCKSIDSMTKTDGVSEDDYRDQNPIEPIE